MKIVLAWAQAQAKARKTKQNHTTDSNGVILETGDSVVLIKDLK
jgi:uncharacterized Zn ribbon protein